jgi:acetylornithine deacetylase/succinyl-diaminopimelate desuccinylase-like protein
MSLGTAIDKALGLIDESAVVKLTEELVNIPSRTGEEKAAAVFLADHMAQAGLEVVVQEFAPGRANAIGLIRGDGSGPRLMLNGHLDTSITGIDDEDYPMTGPLGPANRSRAFVKDGHVYGCGAFNMKGGVAALVSAAIAVKRAGIRLKGDLIVAGVAGEIEKAPVDGLFRSYRGEHYNGGGVGTIYLLNHGYLPDYALIPEPVQMAVLRGRLGLLFIKVTTRGDMIHANFQEKGKSAIGKMIRVLAALEGEFGPRLQKHRQVLEDAVYTPGLAIGAIEGGWPYKPFTSPAVCCAYLDFRIPLSFSVPQAERELGDFLAGLRQRDPDLGVEMEVFLSKPSNTTRADSPVYRTALANYERVMGKPYARSGSPLASYSDDACLLGERGVEVVVLGPGGTRFKTVAEANGLGVGGERVPIADVVNVARIYAATAIELCSGSRPG